MKPAVRFSTVSLSLWLSASMGLTVAQANTAKFYCGQSKNVPTTMAKTSRGEVPIIRWISTLGETYTPEYRCQLVSEKFQTFYNNGMLNYLTTGIVNEQSVICAARVENEPCTGVLFTLKPNSDPGRTLQQLLSIRDRAPGVILNESAPQIYINLTDFLNTTPVEPASALPSISEAQPISPQGETAPNMTESKIW